MEYLLDINKIRPIGQGVTLKGGKTKVYQTGNLI